MQGVYTQNYFSRRRNIHELLHFKGDDSGYVEGKAFMIWPPRNKSHRVNLEVAEDSALYRFEVQVPHKDGIAFRPHERVCLALKGVRVDQRKESSAPHHFPIILRFPDGVVLKYLSGVNAGKVVDTWEGNTDEWYNPGDVYTVSNAVTIDASETHLGHVPAVICSPMPTISRTDATNCHGQDIKVDRLPPLLVPIADNTAIPQSMRSAQQPGTERSRRSSKARLRKKRRLLKEREESAFSNKMNNNTDEGLPVDAAVPCHERPRTSIHAPLINVSDSRSQLPQVSGNANREPILLEDNNHSETVTAPGEAATPDPQLSAGIRTQRGDIFTPLNELEKGHSLINVIGIVIHVTSERRTRTNEWTRSITLVDPSVVDSSRQSIKVNCFQKKHLEWLPQVEKDDVVILRKLKVVEFHGVTIATGYGDKLRWAVYDPLKHSIRPPNKGNAPEKELIDDGMGYEYSPYWEPFQDSIELEYCRKIGEWWKGLELQKVTIVESAGSLRKRHLLISEASPDLPPKGFFDCTVEVLQKFDNHGGATIVYVTDYTTSVLVHSVRTTWCPPQLSDRVLRCNMWDDARNIAKMMNPGEYWYLHNVRAKWNDSRYMEGTMQLAEKVTQLDETELEVKPYLRALLARKQGFQSNNSNFTSGSTSLHIFPEMLLQDVEESTSFLTCVVELLYIDLNSQEGHLLYVTDYTYNPDLPTIVSTANWARNLEHRVAKIKLNGIQAKISSDLQPGSMYIIQNMRIKRLSVSGSMHGCLGGGDMLIISLNDSSSHRAQTLQRNKEKWRRENMLNAPTMLSNDSYGETYRLPKRSLTASGDTTLQEALTWPAPAQFKVLARAVDFFPFSLEDACVLRCTKCESGLPPPLQGCPRCDDMMETHCKWFYCLYILLRDEKGDELIVSLSGKECMLLQSIDPTDFRCDQVAFRKFLAKLDPILGNLREIHLAWSRNEDTAVDSPLMIFTLESWNIGKEKGYSLHDCTSTQCGDNMTRMTT